MKYKIERPHVVLYAEAAGIPVDVMEEWIEEQPSLLLELAEMYAKFGDDLRPTMWIDKHPITHKIVGGAWEWGTPLQSIGLSATAIKVIQILMGQDGYTALSGKLTSYELDQWVGKSRSKGKKTIGYNRRLKRWLDSRRGVGTRLLVRPCIRMRDKSGDEG